MRALPFAVTRLPQSLEIIPAAKIAVVVAHPDDETIAMGGHLNDVRDALYVHVTDGAPRDMKDARANGFSTWQDYAQARRLELARALGLAGVASSRLHSFSIPDQQAPRHMATIAGALAAMFREREIRLVFTHAYEGGHPDHDATAFAVHAACRLVCDARSRPPEVVELACYHLGAQGFVAQRFASVPALPEVMVSLNPTAAAMKRRMLACFKSQQATLASFNCEAECFRTAAKYDFTKLPNAGRLYYELFDWGLTAAQWHECLFDAIAELGFSPCD